MTPLAELLGESPGIVAVREKITRLLQRQSDVRQFPPILIQGETGTGKGLVARAIHRVGPRGAGPFVDVNCAAIPQTLLEAELFGFERGAFTDARQAKAGLFQAANRGTIFLDEVGLLPEGLQGKLLKVIEERAVRRLGSTRSEPVDVWILSATNEDLMAATRARRFREDLYHRLAVLTVTLPPLRERGRDVLLLAGHFLARACADYDVPRKSLAPDTHAALLAYPWPGNIRELSNAMERVALLSEEPVVTAAMLGLSEVPSRERGEPGREPEVPPLERAVGTAEREHILDALRQTNWNISRAAVRLGISRNTLRYRIEKHGLRPATAPPRTYTPKRLAEKILASRSALEGERKQVTVLFCDTVDSFRLAEQLDPEGMREVLDRALRLMADGVYRYEGTVKFLGDGIMAVFGAPVALEDHAFRAIQAALAIRDTIAGYSDQLKREQGIAIHLRLGLNTGLVVVGWIGDDLRTDYTAIGDTVHLAARLEALAEPGTILIAEATQRQVEGFIRSEPLGPVQVKGRSEPVRVFKVIGRRRARTRFEARAERGLTPLVGRQRELGLLHDCLARARAGRGQAVGVVGDPGVGKSRLVYEFRRSLNGERITWLEGHCVPYGQATPYLPILEILRTNFRIEEGDNPLQIWEKLRQGVSQLDPTLEWTVPFLGGLLDSPAEDGAPKHLDPKERRQKTFEAIRALTVAGAQRRPHVVIVENLHWMDNTSEDYLTFLIESLPGLPLLLFTSHRPGYVVPWATKTYYTQIALNLLTEEEAEMMAAAILGSHELPANLIRIIREKAEGNPLFVEEVTNSLLERGVLVRTNGRVHWVGGMAVEIPATVQDIIGARIDRLDDPIKRTVQTAAVIGREFGVGLLAQIAEMPGEIERHLDTLKRLELVHEKRFFPEPEYIFKHALTQDVAYQSLLDQRRRELHGLIGQTIEKLYADRLEEQAAILAYHYGRSKNQEKAVAYALLAGDRAANLFANAEASTYYEQALAIARGLPASLQAHRWHIDAALKLAGVAGTRQDMERDWTNLERARALAEELEDDARLARILYWLGRIRYLYWEPQTAIEYATQSLEIAERLGDETLAAPSAHLMGRVYWLLADYPRAAPLVERSVEQMCRLGNKAEESTAAGIAGMTFGCMGQFGQAIAYADRGIRLAQEIQNPFAEAAAVLYRGWIRDQRGEWAGALADYQEATRIAERSGDLFRLYIIKTWEGRCHTMAGDPSGGRILLEESFGLAEKIGTRFVLYFQKAWLAACLLELGELDAVIPLSQEAIQLADATGEKLANAFARRTLAEAYSRLEPSSPEKAEGAIHEAIRILIEIDAKPELARTYVSQACLLKTRGEHGKAKERLAQAISMFREMEMVWDLTRAEQALREC